MDDLEVDPARVGGDETLIPVRARYDDTWGNFDIAELTADSLWQWLHSRGDAARWPANAVMAILGHDQRSASPTPVGDAQALALDALRIAKQASYMVPGLTHQIEIIQAYVQHQPDYLQKYEAAEAARAEIEQQARESEYQLDTQIERLTGQLEAAQAENQWKPVSEPPELHDLVVGYHPDWGWREAKYFGQRGWYFNVPAGAQPTHWRYAPHPPDKDAPQA